MPSSSSSVSLSPAQRDLLKRHETDISTGLSSDQVTERREQFGGFNVVKPPIDCPPALCVILPCIASFPSMKAFKAMQPDDAEVKRNGQWIRYDVTSLVTGDIIRLEEGDMVPADCVVLQFTSPHQEELLVDVRAITAEEKPRSAKYVTRTQPVEGSSATNTQETVKFVQPVQLYWGGTVVQGGCIAVVTAIGHQCYVSTLIQQGKFPPKVADLADVVEVHNDDDEGDGIALVSAQDPMIRETV